MYPGFQPPALPAVPGLEGAGVVEDSNGTELKAGTRGVCFFDARNGNGSWQEYVALPASNFIPVPDSVTDESAAQFLVNPVTVVGMLEEIAAPPGEYVLQSAAGSTLGRQLITVAKKRGLKTINLVRRPEQAAELKATALTRSSAPRLKTSSPASRRSPAARVPGVQSMRSRARSRSAFLALCAMAAWCSSMARWAAWSSLAQWGTCCSAL